MPIGFATIDWCIVGVYVLLAALPGFLCRKYVKGQADFLIAGRTLSVFLATATLTATEMGLITVMYWAEFGFDNGFSAMSMGVIAFAATLFVGLTGFMVAGLRASGATTVAEYYEIRYKRGVRIVGGAIVAAAGILNYGVFLRIEAEFVRIVTGIPDLVVQTSNPGSVPIAIPSVNLVMSGLLVIVLSYTLMGGMVSVSLTDYIQFIVLTAGLGITTYWVMTHPDVGGFAGMVEVVREHRPGYGFNPFITGVSPKGAVLGLGVLWIVWQSMHWLGTNTWQPAAFRTAATDSPRTAKIMWSLTAFNYFGRGVIPMLWGIAALAFLCHSIGPAGLANVESKQAMPMFLATMPAGLVGLLMAGMLAALMSTHSSYLLTWSGVLTEDLIAPIAQMLGWEVPQSWRIWITRGFILLLGAFLLLWGLWFEVKQTVWGYLAVTGTMYVAGAMALLAMGLYWKRANPAGAYLGLIGGALPGVVYIALRVTMLIGKTRGFEVWSIISKANDWMTDPRTGVMSFALAPIGMIIGSMWCGRHGVGVPARISPPAPELAASAAGREP